jgi:hypothetical protein
MDMHVYIYGYKTRKRKAGMREIETHPSGKRREKEKSQKPSKK